MDKLLILGIDSVPPEMLYGPMLDKLPTFKELFTGGAHGRLLTCDPPITIPAWMVIMTGRNPGELGIYGFRHRRGFTYQDGYIVNSSHVREPAVWDLLAKKGLKSCVIGVPPSYPPKPVNGSMVSCLITPGASRPYTYPAELKSEIEGLVGEYIFDVTFRVEDRHALKKQLFEMTEKRFKVAEYLAKKQDWNLFIMHEIGFDRLHHAFWKFFDTSHPRYAKGNEFEGIAEEYYRLFDDRLASLIETVGKDVPVLILSDHGSKAMKGAFCINQWLEKEGYLALERPPTAVTELDKAGVDWGKTRAWGWGGYYARIFLNIRGREPQGIVDPLRVEQLKAELKTKLSAVRDPEGRPMNNSIFDPSTKYGTANGDKPDLMVYFGDLDWRSAGTVGHPSLYLSENDTGPDDSVHSMQGVFIYHDGKIVKDLGLLGAEDVAPTILSLFGVEPPSYMRGSRVKLQ